MAGGTVPASDRGRAPPRPSSPAVWPENPRLGIAVGAKGATLAGLAGVGDLVATCASPRGRAGGRSVNDRPGRYVPEAAQRAGGGHVAEGVTSCESVLALASSYTKETPLTDAVHRVCHRGKKPPRRRPRCWAARTKVSELR